MKKIISIVFALCFAYLANAQAQSTNVVQLTDEQYSSFTNSLIHLSESFSNVIAFLDYQSQYNHTLSNQLNSLKTSSGYAGTYAIQLYQLFSFSQGLFFYDDYSQLQNGSFSQEDVEGLFLDFTYYLSHNIKSVANLLHLFIDGSLDSAYNTQKYNFAHLVDLIESFFADFTVFKNQLLQILRDNLEYLPAIDERLEAIHLNLTDTQLYFLDFFSKFRTWSDINTNQVQTIIHIISNRYETSSVGYEVISNLLDDISSDLGYIKDNWSDVSSSGGGGGGVPGGGSTSVDLSYFDRWLKEWVEKYFYPDDSYEVLELNQYGNLVYRYHGYGDWVGDRFVNKIVSFEVPFLGFHKRGGFVGNEIAVPLDSPEWLGAFDNTLQAYNQGHTNFYDITSALLTDIQSVNAQHYALFYVLATNILLSGQTEDMTEVSNQFSQIDRLAQQIYSFTNQFGNVVSQNVAVVENKFQVFADNCKQITDYLATIPQLPEQDYYVNLPTWEIFDREYGGMEITLKLTDESFIVVLEILHAFFLLMWWVTVLGVFFLVGRLCYKMFFALYKTFLFTSFMATE